MTWLVTTAFGQALGLAVSVLLFPLVLWPMVGIIQDVWQLPMLVHLRPRLASVIVGALALLAFILITWLLGPAHLGGRLLLSLTLAARPALWLTRVVAWRRTDPALRGEAADIRNELANRLRERTVHPDRVWRTFVFDVERAARRRAYEPPPI